MLATVLALPMSTYRNACFHCHSTTFVMGTQLASCCDDVGLAQQHGAPAIQKHQLQRLLHWSTSFARARVTATLTRRQSASSRPASLLGLERTSDTNTHSLSRPCAALQHVVGKAHMTWCRHLRSLHGCAAVHLVFVDGEGFHVQHAPLLGHLCQS